MIGQVFDPFRMTRGWDGEDDLNTMGEHGAGISGPMRQYVSFSVGGGEYAVDILSIREFKRWTETTALPNTPPYVNGVINLRGIVVPVYDLQARFGQGATVPTSTHVIMMVAVSQDKRDETVIEPVIGVPASERTVGLMVDAVDDVLSLPVDALSAVPETEATAHPFVQGVLTVNGRMITVLDLDRLLSHGEFPGLAL